MRTVVFQIAAVIILPIFFDVDGIWWSIVAAECMAVICAGIFLIVKRHKFKY
jgi:Na+-driven multidrug efflux pump